MIDKLFDWIKDRKDPMSTIIGILLAMPVIFGTSPAEFFDRFLTMPKEQFIRLLSGIVLALVGYYIFKRDAHETDKPADPPPHA